jgi:hypothetical protein
MSFKNRFFNFVSGYDLIYLKHKSVEEILKKSGLAELDEEGNVIGVKTLKATEHFGKPRKAIIEGFLDIIPGYNLFRAYKDKKNNDKKYRVLVALGAEFSNVPFIYPTASYLKEALNHVSLHSKLYKQALKDKKEFIDLDSKVRSLYQEQNYDEALPFANYLNDEYIKGYPFKEIINSKIEFASNKNAFLDKELKRRIKKMKLY